MTETTGDDPARAGGKPAGSVSTPPPGEVPAPQGNTSARVQENAGTPSARSPEGQSGAAVSLLARVMLPRPGEPLDVRKLYLEESKTNSRRAHSNDRTSLQIPAESEVSFATYFNAFPASYWRRWTTCKSVVLRTEPTGRG